MRVSRLAARLVLLGAAAFASCAIFFAPSLQPPEAAAQVPATPAAQSLLEASFFPETGYRLADERFAVYFHGRGGVATFGYPTSRRFFLLNTQVQFFQRHVMQLHGNGRVALLNLLDPELLPFTRFGDLTVPPAAAELALAAPAPGSPTYGDDASRFVATTVPNDWQGRPVGFLDAFLAPGRAAGTSDPILQVLIGLELYGFPTSAPAVDPNNTTFVYQRFQRTVLHFDANTGTTQPLLLADALKSLITGRGAAPALLAQAEGSPLMGQYNPARPLWLLRPELLPGSDLTAAFEPEDRGAPLPLAGVPPALWLPPALPGAGAGGTGLSGTFSGGQLSAQAATAPTATSPPLPVFTPISVQPSPTPSPTPNPSPPVIDRTEPGSVPVGRDVTLRGRNFGDVPGHVLFTGKLTTASLWADTHIIVTVPQEAVDGTVRIRRADGTFSNEVGFAPAPTPTTGGPTVEPTFTPTPTPGPPAISTVSPYNGSTGRTFLVQGSNFGDQTGQVLMGSGQATVDFNGWSNNSVVARVPDDIGVGAHRLSVRRGTDG
ncbi:MAG TPA: IPT/TIG domain-containing protein, partial [Chloroflexota bacterium]|nr:IPT/TIG domain-containing protein [Chloroflexota bacterium]